MATWQFNLFLIPQLSLLNKYKHIPIKLNIDQDNWDNQIRENDLTGSYNFEDALSISWWLDLNIFTDDLFPILEKFGPEDKWATAGLKNFGSADTNNISVCFNETSQIEEVGCRFDLREIDKEFIDRALALAKQFNCLLMDNHGVLIQPVLPDVFELLKSSNAFRFVSDPNKFLNDLSAGKIKL